MTKFACDIVTPEAKFYSDEVHFVGARIRRRNGFPLRPCALGLDARGRRCPRPKKTKAAPSKEFAVEGGYVQVSGDKVIILADKAEEK